MRNKGSFDSDTEKLNSSDILYLLNKIETGYCPNQAETNALNNTIYLSLNQNDLTEVPHSIDCLVNLESLDLSGSPISMLPISVCSLKSLRHLSLHSTDVAALPKEIGSLTSLQQLDLSNTDITALPESIGNLTKLSKLDLNSTHLTALPESIGMLTSLCFFDLHNTKITALPESIGNLLSLQTLNLSASWVSVLPYSFSKLSRLRSLHLSDTQITTLPEWLGSLPALANLNLAGLTIDAIPKGLALRGIEFVDESYFDYDAIGINLHRTVITEQQKSIFMDTPELIPALYSAEDYVPLRECKVCFLGDGDSGKSYTIRRIREGGVKESEENPYVTSETPGVEILDYIVDRGDDSFTIHFWDFGGQQLLHSMHRCFLTEETCYVVTVKSRETRGNERARYWLRNIEAFAPNSPVLLYVNCWGNDDGLRCVDEPRLRQTFPNIVAVCYCSAKEAENVEFQTKLVQPILNLATSSAVGARIINRKWDIVRRAIQQESGNYLTKQRYHMLCTQAGIENENAPALLTFFNNLGVCFSYHRDSNKQELAEYRLLKPVWLTNAVYAIIEEGRVFAQAGRIPVSAVNQMLANPGPACISKQRAYRRTVPELVYTIAESHYVLDVAVSHFLCYRVDKNTLFFPALCEANTPQEAMEIPAGFPRHVAWELKYAYLPDTVIHQLMVRSLHQKLNVECCWLKGMMLSVWDIHKAYVKMIDDETLCIDVWSRSDRPPYDFFWMLRQELGQINAKLNLQAEEYIVDGADHYELTPLLEAARDNAYVYGKGGKRSARMLLGNVYEESFVKTMQRESGSITVQIAFRDFHPCSKEDKSLRYALFDAYNHICPYCGNEIKNLREMQVDHILPAHYQDRPELRDYITYLSSCGFNFDKPDYIENYFPVHSHCNREKSNHVNEFSLPYWHELATRHVPQILSLMDEFKRKVRE